MKRISAIDLRHRLEAVLGAMMLAAVTDVACADTPAFEAPPINDAENFGGLPEGAGREIVFYQCAICHSTRIVLQQRLSRDSWDETLDWMVEEQGMAEPTPEIRRTVLDYLTTHLNPDVPR